MGLLDNLSKREPPPEPKPGPPPVGHFGVRIELKEEKVSLTAGQTKEYALVVTNTGTEDDTIRIKVDLVYHSELPDPPEWTVKLHGVEDKRSEERRVGKGGGDEGLSDLRTDK